MRLILGGIVVLLSLPSSAQLAVAKTRKRACVPAGLKAGGAIAWKRGPRVYFCLGNWESYSEITPALCASFHPKRKRFAMRPTRIPKDKRLVVTAKSVRVCAGPGRKRCRRIRTKSSAKPADARLRMDGKHLALLRYGTDAGDVVELYATKSGRLLRTISVKCNGYSCTKLRWLYKTLYVWGAAAGPHAVARLYDAKTRKLLARIKAGGEDLNMDGGSPVYLGKGGWGFVGDDKLVTYDLRTGARRNVIPLKGLPASGVGGLGYAGVDKRTLAAVGPRGRVVLYDLKKRKVVMDRSLPTCR